MHNITQEDINKMRQCAYKNKPYKALVEVQLSELVKRDNDQCHEHLSMLATSTPNMTSLDYRVVDWKDDDNSTLILEVSGGVKDVVKIIEQEQFV